MWGMIVSLVQGIVTGVVGPMFTYLGKKQDVSLEGAKAAFGADQVTFKTWTDYNIQHEQLQAQSNNWWGPRFLYMIAGGAAVFHFAAVLLDSMPLTIPFLWHHEVGSWGVVKPPGDYGVYEIAIVGSVCVISVVKGPLSAATAWLNRR